MKKQLVFINGTMGSGKSATSHELLNLLPQAVMLDGDWCWMMHPFVVTDETKALVLQNITCLLLNFLDCPVFDTIIFCWVMPEYAIIEHILGKLDGLLFDAHLFTLTLSDEALTRRLQIDVARGKRKEDVIARSLANNRMYDNMPTIKIDVSQISAKQAAAQIARVLFEKTVDKCPNHV